MSKYKASIQSLIDHIKTAIDVDEWAKEMAEELLQKAEPVKPSWSQGKPFCGDCGQKIISHRPYCPWCGRGVKWE